MQFELADEQCTAPSLYALGRGVALAVWEAETAPARALPKLDGAPLPAPFTSTILRTSWGVRVLAAFRWPERSGCLSFVDSDDRELARLEQIAPEHVSTPDTDSLLDGLDPSEALRAIRMIIQSCRAAFGLGHNAAFAALCRALVLHLVPSPEPLAPVVACTQGLALYQDKGAARLGVVTDVILIGQGEVRRNQHLPTEASAGALRIALEPGDGQPLVLFLSPDGLACRRIVSRPHPKLLQWLETAKPSPALREYVGACLARASQTDPAAGEALRSIQLLYPLPAVAVTTKDKPVGGEIALAASFGAGGLFVSGWLHDPHGLIKGITAISPTGRTRALDGKPHHFPREDVVGHYGAQGATGFALSLPADGKAEPALQHRFELNLRSGEKLELIAPAQPASAMEARNAVLGAVPHATLTDAVLEAHIAPAARALHEASMTTKSEPEVTSFGRVPERPAVSLVIPLYRVLSFLRFQIGAFAIDPAMADCELIFVLDSPEQRSELEHLLRGLHALYGLPFRLAIMPANRGFAAASNAGAKLARAPLVLFLNSDAIPDKAGWLAPLVTRMQADARLGAVGPKLLFDDDSLQHAGMHFARDLTGAWYNLHFHKGLPRDYPAANQPRLVPAVTGAALMTRSSLIEKLGGFSEDYIIGDYEDSDLCLRLRADGHEIGYVPQSELYHLERQSISRHAGYMRGVACAYNRHLHAQRWSALMETLTNPPATQQPATRQERRRRRRAA